MTSLLIFDELSDAGVAIGYYALQPYERFVFASAALSIAMTKR